MIIPAKWNRVLLSAGLYTVPAFIVGFVVATIVVGRRTPQGSGPLLDDLNKDGKADLVGSYSNGILERIECDRNFDGKRDETVWYESELPVRSEADDDFDGKTDVWSTYRHALIAVSFADTDFDGVPDVTNEFQYGVLTRVTWRIQGTNLPGKVEFYTHGVKRQENVDADGDGIYETTNCFDAFENLNSSAGNK